MRGEAGGGMLGVLPISVLTSLDRRSLPDTGARLLASKPQQSFGVLSLLLPLQEHVAIYIYLIWVLGIQTQLLMSAQQSDLLCGVIFPAL